MATQQKSRPWRALSTLGVITALIFGVVAGGWLWNDARWVPGLALDLEGGTQIILAPEVEDASIGSDAIDQAVAIIRQRVNGSGVSEAEVARQGASNILVSLPGTPSEETKDLVRQSAQLAFRPVLQAASGFPEPAPTATQGGVPLAPPATPTAGAGDTAPAADPSASATGAPEPTPEPGATAQGRPAVQLPVAAPVPTAADPSAATDTSPATDPSAAADTSPATDSSAATDPPTDPTAAPTDASDLAWITPDIQQQFSDLDCTQAGAAAGGSQSDHTKPLVACSDDGSEKYVLGPVEVEGVNVRNATAVLQTNSQGYSTGGWVVNLEFDGTGTTQFADVTTRLFGYGQGEVRNRFAIVLDDVVVSAPSVNGPIPDGNAEISGNFTEETSKTLANQLKFGALPISFTVQTEETISATLGTEQLERGLLAGAVGLLLVVLYSLIQYRGLAIVTIASLAIAALLTYGLLLFLSWRQGYRLSLPGVAGLIVAIGITADSFIVYFERIRDEIRDGRSVATAVEVGWQRAARTIIASDAVNLLAATVLFLLAVGGVRGFAFTLGLTTVVDLVVVFLFTKPAVTLLSRTRFFGSGHKLSGFDPEHLGSVVARSAVRAGRPRRPAVTAPAPTPVTVARSL